MSSFLDSTGLDRLATKLKAYFMKKPTTASTSSYPLVGYDATNNVGKYNSGITVNLANKNASVNALKLQWGGGTDDVNSVGYIKLATISATAINSQHAGIIASLEWRYVGDNAKTGEGLLLVSFAENGTSEIKPKIIVLNNRGSSEAPPTGSLSFSVIRISDTSFEIWGYVAGTWSSVFATVISGPCQVTYPARSFQSTAPSGYNAIPYKFNVEAPGSYRNLVAAKLQYANGELSVSQGKYLKLIDVDTASIGDSNEVQLLINFVCTTAGAYASKVILTMAARRNNSASYSYHVKAIYFGSKPGIIPKAFYDSSTHKMYLYGYQRDNSYSGCTAYIEHASNYNSSSGRLNLDYINLYHDEPAISNVPYTQLTVEEVVLAVQA